MRGGLDMTGSPLFGRRAWPPMVAVTALILAVCVACGSSGSSSSSGTTSTTLSVCSQATALKQSLQDLQNVNVVKNGTSALSSATATVKSNANALAQIGPRSDQARSRGVAELP